MTRRHSPFSKRHGGRERAEKGEFDVRRASTHSRTHRKYGKETATKKEAKATVNGEGSEKSVKEKCRRTNRQEGL